MDSNFQVKITADISELQSRLKSVEAITGKFQQSMNNAAASTKNLEQSANRGRLVAFAFGQVIRDAGFFSQSFALGILAISNNIPILVDQLAQMANLSEKAMSAVSLLGSALTAGLTIYAYYAQSVKDANAEYNKAIQNAVKSAETQKSTIQSLISIAQDETMSYKARKQAVDELNKSIPQLNDSLTVQNAKSKEQLSILNKIPKAIELQAKAQALATLIGEEYARNLKAQTDSLEDQASIFAKSAAYFQKFISGNQVASAFLLAKSGADEFGKTITSTQDNIKKYREQQDLANKKLAEMGFLTDTTANKTKTVADVYKELELELKKVNSNLNQSFTDKSRDRASAYQDAIESLIELGLSPASKEIERLQLLSSKFNYDAEGLKRFENGLKSAAEGVKKAQEEFNKAERTKPLAIPEQDLPPVFDALNADKGKMTAAKIKAYADGLMPGVMDVYASIAATITDGMADVAFAVADGIGKMLTGEMGVADFGRSILASIGSFLSQLGKQMMAFGIAALLFGKVMLAIAAGGPAAMIALAPGLIAAGAALAVAGSVVSSLAGGKKGNAAMAGGGGMNTGGFTSQFTTPMSNAVSSSMYGRYNGTLETRVSGNDLVILMNRADRNRRGNY